MDKRFWINGIIMTIAALLLGFVVHGLLLADDYAALVGTVMRPPAEAEGLMQWMVLANICIGFAMAWFYRQGVSVDRSRFGQGLRFGLAVALLTVIPQYLIHYVVDRVPGALVNKQLVFDTVRMVLLGLLVAWLTPNRAR